MGKLIGELLVEAKALSREKLDEALKITRPAGKKLGQLLIELGFVTEAQLTQSLSLQLSVPWVSLYHIDFSRQLLNRVPRELAEKHCLVPIFVRNVKGQGDTMYVAIEDPGNEAGLAEVKRAAGIAVRPMIASPSDIRSALRVYYGNAGGLSLDESDGPPTVVGSETRKHDPPPLPPKRPRAEEAKPEPKTTPSQPPLLLELESLAPDPVDSPDAVPEIEVSEVVLQTKKTKSPRMVALTLLDGTSIQVPARPSSRASAPPSAGGMSDQLTARDLISALRALAHGADASEVLGDKAQWEAMFAALLSLLLRKGIIADWEFVDELRKI